MTATRARVLCLDGGLADLGWVVATVHANGRVVPHGAGVVHTTPTQTGKVPGASTQLGTSVSADAMRRAAIIAGVVGRALVDFDTFDRFNPAAPFVVAIEAFTPPRGNAQAALKVGMGIGAALAAGALHRASGLQGTFDAPMHLAQVTAAEVKRVLEVPAGLAEGASKLAVRTVVRRALPDLEDLLADVPRARQEHAYDAAGVLLACIDKDRFTPVLRMTT